MNRSRARHPVLQTFGARTRHRGQGKIVCACRGAEGGARQGPYPGEKGCCKQYEGSSHAVYAKKTVGYLVRYKPLDPLLHVHERVHVLIGRPGKEHEGNAPGQPCLLSRDAAWLLCLPWMITGEFPFSADDRCQLLPGFIMPVGSLRQNVMEEGRQVCHTIFILHRWRGIGRQLCRGFLSGRAFPSLIRTNACEPFEKG